MLRDAAGALIKLFHAAADDGPYDVSRMKNIHLLVNQRLPFIVGV